MLEKSRAEERATLRHRNTGKWARNQVIKAKYNKEVSIWLNCWNFKLSSGKILNLQCVKRRNHFTVYYPPSTLTDK